MKTLRSQRFSAACIMLTKIKQEKGNFALVNFEIKNPLDNWKCGIGMQNKHLGWSSGSECYLCLDTTTMDEIACRERDKCQGDIPLEYNHLRNEPNFF